jgi:hypothetical protein
MLAGGSVAMEAEVQEEVEVGLDLIMLVLEEQVVLDYLIFMVYQPLQLHH